MVISHYPLKGTKGTLLVHHGIWLLSVLAVAFVFVLVYRVWCVFQARRKNQKRMFVFTGTIVSVRFVVVPGL